MSSAATATPLLVHVEHDDVVAGVALQTDPRRRLVLSAMSPDAAAAVATAVYGGGRALPGVVGPVPAAGEFATAWTGLTGQRSDLAMGQRLYRLDHVNPPIGVPGAVRNARQDEGQLVSRWATAMADDIGLDSSDRDPHLADEITRRVTEGRISVWEVAGEVVSMAGPTRPAAGVVRIGLVYTRPSTAGTGTPPRAWPR